LKSTIENLTPTRIKVQVEVPFSELKPSLDAAYQKIAGQISVPGFRKGKVPTQVIDQRVGRPAVLQEAVNEAVPKAYADALKDKKVYPIGRPNVKVEELKENEELKFSAEVDVRPDFETPKYRGLKLQVDKARELGEDVLKQLEDLRARFSTLTAVERAVKDQDVVILDITGTKDGEQVNQYSGQALAYTVGSDGLVPGADKVLIGAKAEQKLKHDFTPEDGPFKDQQISLDITVNSVNEKVLPDADDDFAKMASEFDTLAELKKDLEVKVKQSRIIEQTYLAREKAGDALIALMAKVPLPENAIESEFEEHFKDGHGDDVHKEEFKVGSRRSMQSQFVLDKIAEDENIGVSDADLSEWITQNAMKYQMAPQTFADALVRSGEITLVMGEIRRSKALTLVVKEADVTDADGNKVDVASVLKEFVPDGE
jgi:trigger factor